MSATSTPRALTLAVTGATGFLGPYLIQQALARGYNVRVLARTPAKIPTDLQNEIEIVQGNLSEIPLNLTDNADVVLHMAGLIKARSRGEFYAVNEGGTRALATQAQTNNVARFIYLSSQAASQPQLSNYAASKRAGETALHEAYKGEAIIIRAPAVFGPGDQATAPFFAAMKRGVLPVPGGKGWRERKLSLIYAPDLARFIIDQIEAETIAKTPLTPASIAALTWPEFAQAASAVMGRSIKPLALPLPILKVVAGINSSLLQRAFNPHLTLGKLSEFLYEDWSVEEVIDTPTSFQRALKETMAAMATTKHNITKT